MWPVCGALYRRKLMKQQEVADWLKEEAGKRGPAGSDSGANLDLKTAEETEKVVAEIIRAVRQDGDRALRHYAARFDRSNPQQLELPMARAKEALQALRQSDTPLVEALELSAEHLKTFAQLQAQQFADFSCELAPGLVASQRVVPVQRAAVYVPAGAYPYVSSVLMGAVTARVAGCKEVVLASPPLEDGQPDRRILAAAAIAGVDRVFAIGGAQAIAALALGTESVPRVDVVVGPGNRFVATAKRQLYGEVGIDLVAGPTDVLIIADAAADPQLIARDLLAQAEHDADARARLLVPNEELAKAVLVAIEVELASLATAKVARASLAAGGLILRYQNIEQAIEAANRIAPEHLELHVQDSRAWQEGLVNYGSLFIGSQSAEVIGDYCGGINHTLPTSGNARFTGGLSVRHFLKTLTALECSDGAGYRAALRAASIIGRAEALEGHAKSAEYRLGALEDHQPK